MPQVGAFREVLAQQSLGVLVAGRCHGVWINQAHKAVGLDASRPSRGGQPGVVGCGDSG